MARKLLNRKDLRAEAEAVEKLSADEKKGAKKTAKKKAVKKATRRRTKKAPVEVRLKAYWGVFNQSLKRVALFEYSQRKQADKKAGELSTKSKHPHFVQQVKEVIEEPLEEKEA